MKKYIILLFIAFLSLQNSVSQSIWYADIDNIQKSGYYNIELPQQLIGASEHGLKDMFILNADSVEVPYFLRSASPMQEISNFENYTLKENTTRDSLNIIIVDNEKREDINRFYITIANADVNISMSIRGSNNLKQWYIVKRQSSISNYANSKNNDAMLILDFPKGDYRYYEITLSTDQKSPLQVKSVAKTESSNIYGQFSEITIARNIKVETKDQKSLISFPNLKSSYYINKAEFFISNKSDYLRRAQFIDSTVYSNSKFDLSSKGDNIIFIQDFHLTPNSFISIDNNNNPPLSIDSIKLYGLNRYACAYLEAGGHYFIKVDNEINQYPNYDIEHFRNDISINIPTLKTSNISVVKKPIFKREQLFIEKPIFLWSIIIGVGILLVILCVQMLKSIKKRDNLD